MLQSADHCLCGAVEAALQIDGARAGHHVSKSVGEDGIGQDGRRAGAVADDVASLFRGLPHHLRAQILFRLLELEFLGDCHAVIADDGRAPFLLDENRLRAWAEGDTYGIRELTGAAQNPLASGGSENHLFVGHGSCPRLAQDMPAPVGLEARRPVKRLA